MGRLALLLLVPLLGDVITTKANQKLTGRIVKEDDESVTVRTYKDGDVTVARADIKSIVPGKTKFDDYEAKVAKDEPQDAAGHFKIGTWCKQQGLIGLAEEHLRKALELDPKMDKARVALGLQKFGDSWVSAADAKAYAVATGLDLPVAVEGDLPEARLRGMAELFASFADDFWFMTEGNFYLKSVTVKDKSQDANCRVFVGAGDEEKQFIEGGGVSNPGVRMKVAGKCSVYTFLHEAGHVFWSLPDEYKSMGGGCPACVMVGGQMEGFGPGKWKFCDGANHTGQDKTDCWTKIQQKHKTAKHPNPGVPKDPPKPTVTVTNQGR